MANKLPIKIAIIGAGFSGTALAANLYRLSKQKVEILLIEKKPSFGKGEAYNTPYPFHLLNVRSKDMSAFEDDATHFVKWIKKQPEASRLLENPLPIEDQFVPRVLYGKYLTELIEKMQTDKKSNVKLHLVSGEVVDIITQDHQIKLIFQDQHEEEVDKVVFALGNHAPISFPFPVATHVKKIMNPWDFRAPEQIDPSEPVLIVGTGLSMIDAVLTLHHQQHQAKIYAISRHGMLPLPHTNNQSVAELQPEELPKTLRHLIKHIRKLSQQLMQDGGDWRSFISGLRHHIPKIWLNLSAQDKKRFLRHLLSYWNIHRHRVHDEIADLLAQMPQLEVFAGRVIAVEDEHAIIKLRHKKDKRQIKIKWLINCMGPSLNMKFSQEPLIKSLLKRGLVTLDELNLGFAIEPMGALKLNEDNHSTTFFALGPPTKGHTWETSAVPEIRKQCFALARHLLAII